MTLMVWTCIQPYNSSLGFFAQHWLAHGGRHVVLRGHTLNTGFSYGPFTTRTLRC